ncbi:ABC transporter substrate-binding protein [Streptomyces sp. NPDC002758]
MRTPTSWRTAAAVAVGSLLAAAATACTADSSGQGTSAQQTGSGTLHVSFATAPSSLDPAVSCTGEDRQLTNSLYTRLVDFGTKSGEDNTKQVDYTKVVPYLAKSWDASGDGKTYTFHLNSGWKFPSGKAMDAQAVKYSLERTLKMNQCGSTILNDLYSKPSLIKSISTPDDTTVVVELTRADPQVLSAFADTSGGIVDPGVVEAHGGVEANKPNTWMASNSAGGGAFVLKSYTAGSSATLSANPTYRGPAPASKEIDITWSTSASTQLLNVQNGTTDVAIGLSGTALSSLTSSSLVKVPSYDDTQSMVMTLPNNKAPWTNEKVREAVVKAIPTDDIIKNVVKGFGKAYYGPIAASMPGYSDTYGKPVKQDLAQAKQLIAQSGVKTPISATLDILSGDQNQKSIATIIQSSLKQIGININIRTLTSSAWSDAVYNGKSQSALRFDGPAIANAGYYLQYDEDCGSSFNTGHICIDANTDLLKKARASNDSVQQAKFYAEITKNYVEKYPRVTLYQSLTPVALSKSVKSFYFSTSLDMRTWATS